MKLRPNMTLCEVFAAEEAEMLANWLLEQEDEEWSDNWQPTPVILAWFRRLLTVLRDNTVYGAPSTGQIYLLSHKRKTFALVYGSPNDSKHWHDKNKVVMDTLGYRVLDRPEVPPDNPEQVKKSIEAFRKVLSPEEFAKLTATALGPAPPPTGAGDVIVTEDADPFTKSKVTLQYRPFMLDGDWKWVWVLLPQDRAKALAHGQEDNRAKASVAARLKALELGVTVGEIDVLKPHTK